MSNKIWLGCGSHPTRDGMCVMEYVAMLAGEEWGDHPACVDPFLARLARMVNDHTADCDRQRLVELAPRFIGTVNLADDAVWERVAERCGVLCNSACVTGHTSPLYNRTIDALNCGRGVAFLAEVLDAFHEVVDGNIGEPQKHIEFEPMPETEPIHEPSPEKVPAEPEKVPAGG